MQKLYSAAAIDSRVKSLAEQINKTYTGLTCPIHMVVVMNGSFVFAADLVRHLKVETILHFVGGSFFHSGIKHEVGIDINAFPQDFKQAPVLVIEDILDNGTSFDKIESGLKARNAAHVRLAALLKRQETTYHADFCGFTIPKETFVVGYGLDLDGKHRHLPDLYELGDTNMGAASGRC